MSKLFLTDKLSNGGI